MDERDSMNTKILIIGTLIGAFTGMGAAYLMVKRAEKNESDVSLSSGEGLRLGFIILGLLRSIMQLGDGD